MALTGIQKSQVIEVGIDNLAYGGRGIGRVEGIVVFIDGALPGDVVRARVTRRKPQYAEARLLEIVRPSADRVEPPCPLFGTCGGCTWQNYAYGQQLRFKQQHVEEALRHIGRLQTFEMRPIIASPDPVRYRNKMEYSFGRADDGSLEVGLHVAGDFRHIVGVPACHIQPEVFDRAVGWMHARLRDAGLEPYDQRDHSGYLRHFVLRYSRASGEILAALLTAGGAFPGIEDLAADFMRAFPGCRGFTWGINRGLSDVARMDEEKLRLGPGFIEETLDGRRFRISTFSFFQTNPRGAALLYDVVREFAQLSGAECVLDAYCGTGSIGIYVADAAQQVVGIELVREAVWDARFNAKLNGAQNCTFLAGEMRDVLASLPNLMNVRFDRVIVDPPRGGMDKKALRLLLELAAPVLVYVSCNPATLARDAVVLAEAGYNPEVVQPVDMFPHTYHVESVIRFRHKGAA